MICPKRRRPPSFVGSLHATGGRKYPRQPTQGDRLGREAGGGNSFESLAGGTVADAVLYGEIAQVARDGGFEGYQDTFIGTLNNILGMANVFPPAAGTITLVKAARRTGAINETLIPQLSSLLDLMQADPKSALAVEKFKDNFMPMFELARHCRTWSEFETILRQADSPDQMKVLTKMASGTPAASKRLAQILAVASREGRPVASACIDLIMRQGTRGLDTLYAAIGKGAAGLQFVAEHPELTREVWAPWRKRTRRDWIRCRKNTSRSVTSTDRAYLS